MSQADGQPITAAADEPCSCAGYCSCFLLFEILHRQIEDGQRLTRQTFSGREARLHDRIDALTAIAMRLHDARGWRRHVLMRAFDLVQWAIIMSGLLLLFVAYARP